MKQYRVKLSDIAKQERRNTVDYITHVIKMSDTAKSFKSGLKAKLNELSQSAGWAQVDIDLSRIMGVEVRRARYKKMMILYTIEGDVAYVLHIIPQSMAIF